MTQTELVNGFGQLAIQQQIEVIQAELCLLGQQLQANVQPYNDGEGGSDLLEAANLLLMDYQQDHELTTFTILDGEPFHAQK